jgi:hypothetical protein
MEYGSIARSWTHEGTSTLLQTIRVSAPGYPASGAIDLMKYHNSDRGNANLARQFKDTRASEFDVKCLLWMSKLAF